MKNKKIFLIGIVVLSLCGSIFFYLQKGSMRDFTNNTHSFQEQETEKKLKKVKVGDTTLTVELAQTAAELQQGLSGRTEIGSDGLLFLLPRRQRTSFWMKDMQFDLDLIWIDNGKVIEITRNVPVPDSQTDTLPLYFPSQPVTHVLEVVAGDVDTFSITVGDSISFVQ